MKTIRNVILCVSLMFLCIAYSGREAFGAQDAGQTTATKPAQPEATARGSGATVHPLGDYVPCLFAADEVAGMRVLKPERTLEEGPKKIGANTALRVVDAMNAAIAKVIAGYGPASSPKNSGAGPSTKEDNSADLQLFVEEFAQKFFAYVDPDKLKDVTAVQAYGVLSDAARTVADKMSSEILNRTSAYDYFAYRRTTPDTKAGATLPANVQTAITEVENAILAAVRSASTEALEAEPPQLYEPPNDISCSISVMPWKETSDTFGRRVANQFLAIQVTVRNLNTKNEFLMHDIQVAVDTGLSTDGYFWKQYAGRFQAGRDKLLVRAVAQTGQSMSPRNLALNALIVVGAIAGSSSIAGTSDFKTGVAVFESAFIPGFSTLFPDHTVEQLNRINDLVFSASNTSKVVVPVQGSVPLVTFVAAKPIEQLPYAWCGYGPKESEDQKALKRPCVYDPYTDQDTSFPHHSFYKNDSSTDTEAMATDWQALKFSKWKPAALRILQNHLFVVIGGVHIQELTGETKITNLDCPTLPGGAVDVSQAKDGVLTCTVSGSSLDKLSSVNLEKGAEKIAGKVKAAKDGNSASLEFDPSALADGDGLYSLFLVMNDASGTAKETDSGEKVSLIPQTYVASIDPQLDLSKGATVPLTLTGKHLDKIVHLYLVSADKLAVEATGTFTAAKNSTLDKGLTAEFPTSGPNSLITGTTYYLRYAVKDQLGKQIDATSLTVKTINQAPAAGKGATPVITKLSATAGPVGTAITITGTDFGATQGSSTVTFNDTPGKPTAWDATSIAVPVPAGAKTGNVVVTVGGVASKGVKFTIGTVPVIKNLSVASGSIGTSVTITGTDFGATQGKSTVRFGGTTGKPTSWNATTIVVPVPAGAKTGNVVVTVDGIASKGLRFTIP